MQPQLFTRFNSVVCTLILICANLIAQEAGRKFTLTTKSEQAREHIAEAVRRIESFQFGVAVHSVVKKAIELDPEFAFAHYLAGATSGSVQEARRHYEKAIALAANASDAEHRYIEAMNLLL